MTVLRAPACSQGRMRRVRCAQGSMRTAACSNRPPIASDKLTLRVGWWPNSFFNFVSASDEMHVQNQSPLYGDSIFNDYPQSFFLTANEAAYDDIRSLFPHLVDNGSFDSRNYSFAWPDGSQSADLLAAGLAYNSAVTTNRGPDLPIRWEYGPHPYFGGTDQTHGVAQCQIRTLLGAGYYGGDPELPLYGRTLCDGGFDTYLARNLWPYSRGFHPLPWPAFPFELLLSRGTVNIVLTIGGQRDYIGYADIQDATAMIWATGDTDEFSGKGILFGFRGDVYERRELGGVVGLDGPFGASGEFHTWWWQAKQAAREHSVYRICNPAETVRYDYDAIDDGTGNWGAAAADLVISPPR